jgi:hypothetical protein
VGPVASQITGCTLLLRPPTARFARGHRSHHSGGVGGLIIGTFEEPRRDQTRLSPPQPRVARHSTTGVPRARRAIEAGDPSPLLSEGRTAPCRSPAARTPVVPSRPGAPGS